MEYPSGDGRVRAADASRALTAADVDWFVD
jgi:hypothetical protein